MTGRARFGLIATLIGAAGIAGSYVADVQGAETGPFAALSVLAVAVGLLLMAASVGHVMARVCGGVLVAGGLAIVVTHRLWFWLPSGWETPVSLAGVAVALVGLLVLLFAGGFSLAGLSGAFGVLAVAGVALTELELSDLGSEEREVIRVVATALGAVALTAGLAAITFSSRGNGSLRRGAAGLAGVVGAAAVMWVAFKSYSMYAPMQYRAFAISAAVLGAMGALILGLAASVRPPVARRTVDRSSWPEPSAPVPAKSGTSWLHNAAAIVGLITGVIAIARELYAAIRALVP